MESLKHIFFSWKNVSAADNPRVGKQLIKGWNLTQLAWSKSHKKGMIGNFFISLHPTWLPIYLPFSHFSRDPTYLLIVILMVKLETQKNWYFIFYFSLWKRCKILYTFKRNVFFTFHWDWPCLSFYLTPYNSLSGLEYSVVVCSLEKKIVP